MKRISAFFLSFLLLIPLLLTGCGRQNVALDILLPEEPVTLDPQIADDSSAKIVIRSLFEGLTRLDENNEPVPGAAERWEISEDGRTYTFYLREDALWSDETPVAARDFVFAFRRALAPETDSPTCQTLFCLKNGEAFHQGNVRETSLGVSAPDDRILVVELVSPNKDFLRLTATAPFMPCREDYFLETEGKYGLESSTILGNGPFRMENRYSWEHGEYINLLRSSTYHEEAQVVPYKLTMTIADEETETDPLRQLQDGTTCIARLPGETTESLRDKNFRAVSHTDTTWGLCCNTKSENLRELSVRRLLLQAIDRKTLLQYVPADAITAESILPPSTLWNGEPYRSDGTTYLREDPSASKSESSKIIPPVTILCPDTKEAKELCNALITMWNPAFGRYYNMEPLPESQLRRRIQSGDYEIALIGLTADAEGPAAFLSRFASGSKKNPAHWENSAFDKLLRFSSDDTEQDVLERCQKAERMLSDNAVFYPIYYETRTWGFSADLTGVIVPPYDMGIDFSRAGNI